MIGCWASGIPAKIHCPWKTFAPDPCLIRLKVELVAVQIDADFIVLLGGFEIALMSADDSIVGIDWKSL
jgi:hypothetical protein